MLQHNALAIILLISVIPYSSAWVTWVNKEINPCQRDNQPCQNGGTCVMYVKTAYKCICPEDTYGRTCELKFSSETNMNTTATKSYECAQHCDTYNHKGNLKCTQASVIEGDTCNLQLEPYSSLMTKTGQIAACTNPVGMAQAADAGWWSTSSQHPSCLDEYATFNRGGCNWRSADNHFWNQWLQVHFGKDIVATQIAIKPRTDANEWVKVARFYYHSGIGGKWVYMTGPDGREMVVTVFGDDDRSSKRDEAWTMDLSPMVIMNYMRVYVIEYHAYPAMRLEIYGCDYTAL